MSEKALETNAYSDEQMSLIISLRIYDVLMGLLRSADPDMHSIILEEHANGRLVGPSVFFTGNFLQDSLDDIAPNK